MSATLQLTIPKVEIELGGRNFTLKEQPAEKQEQFRELYQRIVALSEAAKPPENAPDNWTAPRDLADKARSAAADLIAFILQCDHGFVETEVLPYASVLNQVIKLQVELNEPKEFGVGNWLRLLPQKTAQ